jgi:hypothetical protein
LEVTGDGTELVKHSASVGRKLLSDKCMLSKPVDLKKRGAKKERECIHLVTLASQFACEFSEVATKSASGCKIVHFVDLSLERQRGTGSGTVGLLGLALDSQYYNSTQTRPVEELQARAMHKLAARLFKKFSPIWHLLSGDHLPMDDLDRTN